MALQTNGPLESGRMPQSQLSPDMTKTPDFLPASAYAPNDSYAPNDGYQTFGKSHKQPPPLPFHPPVTQIVTPPYQNVPQRLVLG